jgi:hypothetical protein
MTASLPPPCSRRVAGRATGPWPPLVEPARSLLGDPSPRYSLRRKSSPPSPALPRPIPRVAVGCRPPLPPGSLATPSGTSRGLSQTSRQFSWLPVADRRRGPGNVYETALPVGGWKLAWFRRWGPATLAFRSPGHPPRSVRPFTKGGIAYGLRSLRREPPPWRRPVEL